MSIRPPAPSSSGTSAAVLAAASYNPATSASVTHNATSYADLDATNLVVTFEAPESGNVIVRLSTLCMPPGGGQTMFWAVRAGTTVVDQSLSWIAQGTTSERRNANLRITGLTPAQSYTWKWCWKGSSTGTMTAYWGQSDGYGPATMVVESAP